MDLVIHIKCSSDDAHQKIEDICKDSDDLFIDEENSWDSWVAERRPNFVNAPDSLKPVLFEGVTYSMEYVDAETVVFTRCR